MQPAGNQQKAVAAVLALVMLAFVAIQLWKLAQPTPWGECTEYRTSGRVVGRETREPRTFRQDDRGRVCEDPADRRTGTPVLPPDPAETLPRDPDRA
ncbi:hypothetical protein ACIF6L_34970 [Kitasatospora sp. NPDC086009]|uniref:hypothetical protein n=1 Tax=unclassified Kitasatospora TaxID=2633591 RepID=UPI0037CA2367